MCGRGCFPRGRRGPRDSSVVLPSRKTWISLLSRRVIAFSSWSDSGISVSNHGHSHLLGFSPQTTQNSAPHRLYYIRSHLGRMSKLHSPKSMVITFPELSCSTASEASLLLFASDLRKESGCFLVFGTFARKVPPTVASHTNLCVATIAASSLSHCIAIMVDINWPNPFPASS